MDLKRSSKKGRSLMQTQCCAILSRKYAANISLSFGMVTMKQMLVPGS